MAWGRAAGPHTDWLSHASKGKTPGISGVFAEEEQIGSVKTRYGDASKGQLDPLGQFPASSTSRALGLR